MTERAKRSADTVPEGPDDLEDRLKESRRQIDQLDEEIVQLLNARAGHAQNIGRLKESVGQVVYQPERELAILEHVRRVNDGPLDAGAVTRLFERIIDENRRLERLAEREPGDDTAETQDPPGSAGQ